MIEIKRFSKEFIETIKDRWVVKVDKDRKNIRFETGINRTSVNLEYNFKGDIKINMSSHGASLEFEHFKDNIEMYQMIIDFWKDARLIDLYEKSFAKNNS